MKTKSHYFAFGVLLYFTGCSHNDSGTKINPVADNRFIKPAFAGVDVPFENYSFSAETGDTLFYKSGTIVLFPPQAFVDKNGKVVSGNVTVKYRELRDPVDYLVSGIPMSYDSGGIKYMFESSGMLEVNAFAGNEPLYVNPEHKPEVNLASLNDDESFNLYYLDTVEQKWITKDRDVITDVSKPKKEFIAVKKNSLKPEPPASLAPPVEPAKANGKLPTFTIVVDPGSAPELLAYNNLKFEVDPDDKNYRPEYAGKTWTNLKLEKGPKHGTYIVTFISFDKSLSILTRPVFEGKAYDEAMKIFEKQQKEYEAILADRLKNEKAVKTEMEKQAKIAGEENKKIAKENERIDKLNALIEARNKVTEAQNKIVEAQNLITMAKNREMERQQRVYALVGLIEANDPEASNYDKDEIAEAMKMVENNKLQREAYEKEAARLQAEQKRLNEVRLNEGLIAANNNNNGFDLYGSVVRTFQIDGFGIWNSDYPAMLVKKGAIAIRATFYDEQNKKLPLQMVDVVYKSMNGVNNYHDCNRDYVYPKLYVIPGKENMMWSVLNNELYYLNYDAFRQANITRSAYKYSFIMKRYPGKITSADDIRKVIML